MHRTTITCLALAFCLGCSEKPSASPATARSSPAASEQQAPEKLAKKTVDAYAFDAYARWSVEHPGAECPDRLEELNGLIDRADTKDPWGADYEMLCGDKRPEGVPAIGVRSVGPDGKPDTPDDVGSWQ